MLGVTVMSISGGEMGTRHRMGKQEGVVVVAAVEYANNADLE